MYFVFIWLRGTLPRLRLDQLMSFCWKFFVPVGLVFVAVAAVERTLLIDTGGEPPIVLPIYAVINWAITGAAIVIYARTAASPEQRLPSRPVMARGRLGGLRAARELADAESGD